MNIQQAYSNLVEHFSGRKTFRQVQPFRYNIECMKYLIDLLLSTICWNEFDFLFESFILTGNKSQVRGMAI